MLWHYMNPHQGIIQEVLCIIIIIISIIIIIIIIITYDGHKIPVYWYVLFFFFFFCCLLFFLLYFIFIMKTYLYNIDPLKPHLYIVKLGFTGVYIIFFLVLSKNIDCGYSLEPPRRGGSNEYPQSVFWPEVWEISEFLSEKFQFLLVKMFSIFE